jgi:hypothetical protein
MIATIAARSVGLLIATTALMIVATSPCQGAIVYSDDFESAALNPFWTVTTSSGSVTFPSTAQTHSATQSVQFNPVEAFLRHDFVTPVYGTTSVWVFDTGADTGTDTNVIFQLFTLGAAQNTYLQGNSNPGTYLYDIWSSDVGFSSAVDRTPAWHQWSFTSTPNEYSIKVDGTTLFSAASGLQISFLRFGIYGGPSPPGFAVYFDDFNFTEFAEVEVPEPTSLFLAVVALGAAPMLSRLRRRENGSRPAS